jgi:hypothetical protein
MQRVAVKYDEPAASRADSRAIPKNGSNGHEPAAPVTAAALVEGQHVQGLSAQEAAQRKPRPRRVAPVPAEEPVAACGLPADLLAAAQPVVERGEVSEPEQAAAPGETPAAPTSQPARPAGRRKAKGRPLPARVVEPPDTVGLPCEGGE